jgi:PIN domain nuclease of toxin-antitoxin system
VGWELAIKAGAGKIKPRALVEELMTVLRQEAFIDLPISLAESIRAGLLPPHHRDPFDRMLVAQAQSFGIPILSADHVLDLYDVTRIW